MPSRTAIFAVIAVLLAILLSPQIASEAQTDGTVINAPPEFVRKHLLDYDLVSGLQSSDNAGSLDALRVKRNGNYLSAINAEKGDHLELQDNSHGSRMARVTRKDPIRFFYREDFPWGQRVNHYFTFTPQEIWTGPATIFEYQRQWKGSVLVLLLKQAMGGKGLLGHGLPPGKTGGATGLKKVVEQEWKEQKKRERISGK